MPVGNWYESGVRIVPEGVGKLLRTPTFLAHPPHLPGGASMTSAVTVRHGLARAAPPLMRFVSLGSGETGFGLRAAGSGRR